MVTIASLAHRSAFVVVLALLTGGLGACASPPPDSPTPASPQAGTTAGAPLATTVTALPAAAITATERAAALLPTFVAVIGEEGIDPGQLHQPKDVAVDDQNRVYVSDSKGVQVFAADGTFLNLVGNPDLKVAEGLAVTPDGAALYVTGYGPLLLVYGPDGQQQGTIGEEGPAAGQLQQPVDVALDNQGNIYVVDANNRHVEQYAPDGRHLLTFGERGERRGQFLSPRSVAVDDQGLVYVGAGDDFLIQRFNPDGTYHDSFGQSYADQTMWQIPGLAVDDSGEIFASQSISHVIQSFASTAGGRPALQWEFGTPGPNPGEFRSPYGVAVHGDLLYVADRDNGRVQVFKLAP